jgi:hypothetical protein
MLKVYEIDGTFLGSIDEYTHKASYKHYKTSAYPDNYRDIYSRSGSQVGYILEFPPGGRGRHLVFDMTGENAGEVSQRVETLFNGKPAVEISYGHGSQTWMLLDISGDFWKAVGHKLVIHKIGYLRDSRNNPLTLRREDVDKVAGAAFLLTRSFYPRELRREPLWFDADVEPRYFRCKPGTCERCDSLYGRR